MATTVVGIGAVIKPGVDGYLTVNAMVASGPAERSGLVQIGDFILEVDGQDVRKRSLQEVAPKIRGELGSTVCLCLGRGSPENQVYAELIRDVASVEERKLAVLKAQKPFDRAKVMEIGEAAADELLSLVEADVWEFLKEVSDVKMYKRAAADPTIKIVKAFGYIESSPERYVVKSVHSHHSGYSNL